MKEQPSPPPGTLQVTVVDPSPKNDPDGGVQTAAPHPPVTVGGGYATSLPHCLEFGPVVVVTFGGQVIVQGATVTVKVQGALLPDVSVAVQVTVVVPSANTDPDGGLHEEVTPGQLSEVVGGG